ncbi:unnamed protein product, partial [Heterosigma akashiwo]
CVTFVPVDVVKERMQVQGSATFFAYKIALMPLSRSCNRKDFEGYTR